jgi:uncharacterized protein (DUF305 family)
MRCRPLCAALLVVAVAAGCGSDGAAGDGGRADMASHSGHAAAPTGRTRPVSSPAAGRTGHPAAPPTDGGGHPPSPSTAEASGFSPTDTAWLQLMIPMNERVLPVLDLAARDGSIAAVRKLGEELAAAHREELTHLRDLRSRAGVPDVNVHEGHDMPGMPTAAQLDALRAARGERFDRLFVAYVRAHLDQSLKVTRGELTAGTDPRALSAAEALADTRTAQLRSLARVG